MLTIRLKKGRDGPHTLACTRADGSVTVQHNRHDFFPPHDLTHYAVESVLDYDCGFYGLVADGWDLADFGAPWPRGKLPGDLDPAAQNSPDLPVPRPVNESELSAIRQLQDRLHAQWRALPPGEAMEVEFPATPDADLRRSGE